jgi:hypothetical protein
MAQRQKATPKRKGRNVTDKEQSERFRQTARKLEANDSSEEFEIKFKKIVQKRHPSSA